MFVSGVGGTGKSFLIVDSLWTSEGLKCAITAPTGLAAFNVGGVTIHMKTTLCSLKLLVIDLCAHENASGLEERMSSLLGTSSNSNQSMATLCLKKNE